MIKYLVMDVDGTLTDGKIYMGQEGELAKAFDIKDGAGIVLTLPKVGITPVIITARESKILSNRCRELKIDSLHQNIKDKLGKLKELVDDLSTVAYAGDDLPDICILEKVGLACCPNDAVKEVKEICNFVSSQNGGRGAVRELCDFILDSQEISKIKNVSEGSN